MTSIFEIVSTLSNEQNAKTILSRGIFRRIGAINATFLPPQYLQLSTKVVRLVASMATHLPLLADVQRLSPLVIRILGGNPGKFTLQGIVYPLLIRSGRLTFLKAQILISLVMVLLGF